MSKPAKSRFSTTDTIAIVRDLKALLVGERLANVYDLNDKTYLLKFSIPQNAVVNGDASNETEVGLGNNAKSDRSKIILLIESGIRLHTTRYTREKNDMPSPFSMKLRKYIKTKRLENITQLGTDRVIDMKFGSGESVNHIIIELYANGNIILTDLNYEIIALLRSHTFDEDNDVKTKVGEIYPIAFTTSLVSQSDANSSNLSIVNMDSATFIQWIRTKDMENNQWYELNKGSSTGGGASKEDKKSAKSLSILKVLLSKDSGVSNYGVEIIEHCLLSANIDTAMKASDFALLDSATITTVLQSFREHADTLLSQLQNGVDLPGYILTQQVSSTSTTTEATADREYIDYVPMLFAQHQASAGMLTFQSFNEAVDEYYSKLESQKLLKIALQNEETARKKVEKVKLEQENIIQGLVNQQVKLDKHAKLIELHAEDIDKVLLVINSCIDNGMSWDDIEEMVAMEAQNGNNIAQLIKKLNLNKGKIILALQDDVGEDSDEDSDEEGDVSRKNTPKYDVEIDISLSAYANASIIYTNKKQTHSKEEKTKFISEKVINNVEESTAKQLQQQKIKRNLLAVRKVHWFEKFNWFITSDGYLCISGRDAQQNEALVKRYLRPGDVYVHADIPGAASCIIRCKIPGTADKPASPISPIALQEAGTFAVCRSSAWTNKVVTSAWWVWSNQVSKTAPSGEYLVTGSFMIYGKKNFLPPNNLEMGFGILWRLDDASAARHIKEFGRRDDFNTMYEDNDSVSMISERFDRYGIDTLDPSALLTQEEWEKQGVDDTSVTNAEGSQHATKDLSADDGDVEVAVDSNGSDEEEQTTNSFTPTTKSSTESKLPLKKGKEGKVAPLPPPVSKVATTAPKKSKHINKKKAARYAEQDDEDRELAMLALGHAKASGETLKDTETKKKQAKAIQERQQKQQKAGIGLVVGNWMEALSNLPSDAVREKINHLFDSNLLSEGELHVDELQALGQFNETECAAILERFTEGLVSEQHSETTKSVGNKSGFLAGIMRRFKRDHENLDATVSKKAAKKQEIQEIQQILEDEGYVDEEEGKLVDELEKLVGSPSFDDVLLYAVPVCGPYAAMKDFLFKVKLSPGTIKKGKATKTAVELFMRSRECSPVQHGLLKGLSDTEMVAIMIGDVKISMPGLQLVKRQIKSSKKKGNN